MEPTLEMGTEEQREFRRWWFKLENSINSDIRFAALPNELLGIFIRMLAVANTSEPEPGLIEDGVEALAVTIRVPVDQLVQMLEELDRRDLIVLDRDFIAIQRAATYFDGAGLTYSASREGTRERKRKSRARRKEADAADSGHCDMSQTREDKRTADKTTQDERTEDLQGRIPSKREDYEYYMGDPHSEPRDDIPLLAD